MDMAVCWPQSWYCKLSCKWISENTELLEIVLWHETGKGGNSELLKIDEDWQLILGFSLLNYRIAVDELVKQGLTLLVQRNNLCLPAVMAVTTFSCGCHSKPPPVLGTSATSDVSKICTNSAFHDVLADSRWLKQSRNFCCPGISEYRLSCCKASYQKTGMWFTNVEIKNFKLDFSGAEGVTSVN